MAKKENNYYFDTFSKGTHFGNEAAVLLQECFTSFQPEKLRENLDKMHKIEHSADELKHDMMKQLMKEFLPPIEREDIVQLSHTIDEVTDCIEDVLLKVYMLNISSLRAEVLDFAKLISHCCETLEKVTGEMANYRKSATLKDMIIEINGLEEEGDRLYTEAMRKLYTEEKDPIAIIAWTTVFDKLEKCCDACEHVVDMVEQVIMKNS